MRKSARGGRFASVITHPETQSSRNRRISGRGSWETVRLDAAVLSEKTGKWVRPYLHIACDQYGHVSGCYVGIEDEPSGAQQSSSPQTE